MGNRKNSELEKSKSGVSMRPARTPEARENQLIALAIDQAEKQLRDGTASSQVITHFLKLGSSRERMEKELLEEKPDTIDPKAYGKTAIAAVKELVMARMKVCGCDGKAE